MVTSKKQGDAGSKPTLPIVDSHGHGHGHDQADDNAGHRRVYPMEVACSVPVMPPPNQTRVGKSLQPGRPGTLKLQQRFGDQLVLVRYRYDWMGLYRYTTVELLVDAAPAMRGAGAQAEYSIRLGSHEKALIWAARQQGARWDPRLRYWTLSGHAVQALGLAHRVAWAKVAHGPRKRRIPGMSSHDQQRTFVATDGDEG